MSEPTFSRVNKTNPLFYLELDAANVPEHYSIAFLPDHEADSLGTSITLSASWTQIPGIYLFLGEEIADETGFVSDVRSFVGSRTIRFMWIENPTVRTSQWSVSFIPLSQAQGALQATVSLTARLVFRNYSLSLAKGCEVAIQILDMSCGRPNPQDTERIASFVFTKPGGVDDEILFLTNSGNETLQTGNSMTIPFSGDRAGSVSFHLVLEAGSDTVKSGLEKLDAGCRYYVDDYNWPGYGYLQSLHYPILKVPETGISLYCSLDPLNPLDYTRTFMNFLDHCHSGGQALESGFRSVYGEPVILTPVVAQGFKNGPSLVLEINPANRVQSESDPYYFTYRGPFQISPGKQVDGLYNRVMCGISGVEYAGMPGDSGNLISFFPGHPAYAPGFKRNGADTISDAGTSPGSKLLTSLARTSWVYFSAPKSTNQHYYAQPESSIFYKAADRISAGSFPTTVKPTDEGDFLEYLEISAGIFKPPGESIKKAKAFPIVPYTLVDPVDIDVFKQLELQVLSTSRRSLLHDFLESTESGTPTGQKFAATPQGLLLQLDQNLKFWEQLTLAKNDNESLTLSNIKGRLKGALQTNQLFLVVSNPGAFNNCASVLGQFRLTLDQWKFQLAPTTWKQHNTIVIFKYAGKSIEELAAHTHSWTWTEAADGYGEGRGNLHTTQADLMQYIAQAKSKAETAEDFKNFYAKVSDPYWNGILFIRSQLSASSFPDELKGLAAGIDKHSFYAHHLGINITPVHNTSDGLAQQNSSIFALIYYEDPVDLVYTGTDYDFKVLSLKILFQNSRIMNFYSQVELMVHQLFGDIAVLPGSLRGNNIILDGFYQRHNNEPSYVFLQQGSLIFDIGGHVLDQVEITRTQFVTLLADKNSSEKVRARFLIGGFVRFKELPDFDVFSFGNKYDSDGTTILENGGLNFDHMAVNMDFHLNQPENKTMTFDAGTISFDMSRSKARSRSLWNHFPLKMSGLVQAAANTTPGDMGYISVQTPLPQGALQYPWYSLNMRLDLGTLGALAGDVGLVVTLVAAWAPTHSHSGDSQSNSSLLNTYIGIKLPGSTSSNAEIPIEGVLKLGFRSIQFNRSIGDAGNEPSYILRFREIALRLLSLSFPPGQTDLYLFGDPGGAKSQMLGWYAAYAKEEKK